MRPSLPSAVAYLALAGLVAETRLELFALRKSDAQRRGLEQSDADVLSAAKLLENKMAQSMFDMAGKVLGYSLVDLCAQGPQE